MYVVGLREDLLQQVNQHFQLEVFPTMAALPSTAIQSRILIDAHSVDEAEIYEYCSARPEFKFTYIVDEVTSTLTTFAAANRLELVKATKLMSYLHEQLPYESPTPVLAFWGVYPRLGTTTIALSVARELANQHNQSVGMLGLNAYSPGHWLLRDPQHHLDNLHSFLQAHKLDRDLLLKSMEFPFRVHYLLGERNQTRALEYKPEEITYLIEVAKSLFDVLVLDLGSILNTALALQGLSLATQRYVVADDSLVTKRAFETAYDHVLRPLGFEKSDLLLIGNHLQNARIQTFAKSIELTPIASIPELAGIGFYAEQQPDGLKSFWERKPFHRAIEAIAAGVIATQTSHHAAN